MSDSPPRKRRRIDRFEELQIVSMSDVEEEFLVYDVYHRDMPALGFRPEGGGEILVSFAPHLAGAEITLDVLRTLFADIEARVERERLEDQELQAWLQTDAARDVETS